MKRDFVKEIVEVIEEFEWKVLKIWIDDNCIYAEVEKPNGKTETEGLYAGSDFDKNDVYKFFEKLKSALINKNILK